MAKRKQASNAPIQVAQKIKLSVDKHTALVKVLNDLLEKAKQQRNIRANRFEVIDKDVAGYLKLDADDSERMKDNVNGFGVKPVDAVIPLTAAQLDEATTYLLSVVAPDTGIYEAVAPEAKQDIATGFSALMNKHAAQFQHYRHLSKGLYDAVKYNFGGWIPEWATITGNTVTNGSAGVGVKVNKNQELFAGNKLNAIDVYNFLYDISVDPTALHTDGQFFAIVKLTLDFHVEREAAKNTLFSIERFIGQTNHAQTYYKKRPEVVTNYGDGTGSTTNWEEIFGAGDHSEGHAIEDVHMYMWINPKKMGLSTDDELQIWKFRLIDGKYIAFAELQNNAHGLLPVCIAMPQEDGFTTDTKSFAELLAPFQRFASFQLNVHQKAARKALYGLTIYDDDVIPEMANADMLGGKVPAKSIAHNKELDLNKAIKQIRDVPDTSNTIRDVSAMDELMQKVLPTDMLRQVTSLERATKYQAAATVQSANRRNLKIAKLIDSQAMQPMRLVQMYNILQFGKSMELINEQGDLIKVDPTDFRDANLEFSVADGLKGLDKLTMIETSKEILNAVLQSKEASARIDPVQIINWVTSMIGDHTDFAQFGYDSEFDKLSREEKDIAFQLLQQAAAAQQEGGGQPALGNQTAPTQ